MTSEALNEAVAIDKAVKQEIHEQPKPLTAEEIIKHPAFASTAWNLEPAKNGKCQVAKGRRGGPFDINWEIHGTGDTKIVFVMGLGGMRTAWKRQTRFFGHKNSSTYSCLIFDNRGIGGSGKPTTRYSTTEMAQDAIDLLTSLKWLDITPTTTSKRNLNFVGISMGGMICQELGLLIPEHIQSLQLVSTAPRVVRTIPFMENIRQRINMFVPRQIDVQLEEVAHRLFSASFLARKDTDNADPSLNFPTLRDRFAAGELQKRMDKESFTRKGFILQAIAGGWHHKSAEQLNEMADKVGRDRISIMHGKGDRMLTFPHFEMMRNELGEGGGIQYKVWDECGHIPLWEKEDEFNRLVGDLIKKTSQMNS